MELISGKNNKPIQVVVHYNRKTAEKGMPWTIHVKGRCIQVNQVVFSKGVSTVYMPNKKTNPKGFLKTKGKVKLTGSLSNSIGEIY